VEEVNGQLALVTREGGRATHVLVVELAGQRLSTVAIVANPATLDALSQT
jgi:hypothetical protein